MNIDPLNTAGFWIGLLMVLVGLDLLAAASTPFLTLLKLGLAYNIADKWEKVRF